MRTISFKAVMSRGDDIPLDAEDVKLVMQGVENGQPVRVKSGLINPSYLISIVEDKESLRVARFKSDLSYLRGPDLERRRAQGMEPLQDILADTQVFPALKSGG